MKEKNRYAWFRYLSRPDISFIMNGRNLFVNSPLYHFPKGGGDYISFFNLSNFQRKLKPHLVFRVLIKRHDEYIEALVEKYDGNYYLLFSDIENLSNTQYRHFLSSKNDVVEFARKAWGYSVC